MTAGKKSLRVTPKEKTVLATMYKTVVALCQLGAQAIAWGLLHGTALHVTSLVIAAIGLIGVYQVPNAPKEVVAGTAELEGRLGQLEQWVPDLRELVTMLGTVVQNGITKAFAEAPTPQVTVVAPPLDPGLAVPTPADTPPAPPPDSPADVLNVVTPAKATHRRRPSPHPITEEKA